MYSRGVNEGQEKRGISANPKMYPQGYFKDKSCKECKGTYSPQSPSHLYCSAECSSKGFTRKYLRKAYKITYEEYIDMYNQYQQRCHICLGPGFKLCKDQKLPLAVDPCHKTGLVRGMLCHNCNRGLGLFQDNPDYLRTAVEYLERATTISKESTPKQVEARDTLTTGDDIV